MDPERSRFRLTGRTLAAADGASVRVWDTGMIYRAHTTAEESTAVSTIALAPSGALLAVGHNDGILELRNAANGQLTRSLEGGGASVRAIAFSHDGSLIAEARDDRVQLWNHESGRVVRIVTEGKRPSVAQSPRMARLRLSVTAVQAFGFGSHPTTSLSRVSGVIRSERSACWYFRLTARSSRRPGLNSTAQLWTLASGRRTRLYVGGDGATTAAFSPNGRLLATGCWNHIALWRRRWRSWGSGAVGFRLPSQRFRSPLQVSGIAFSPDGHILASASGDGLTL